MPVAIGGGADTDGRDRYLGGDLPRKRLDDALDYNRESAGLSHRVGIGQHIGGALRITALNPEPAERVHRLRGEADMPHHWNTALDQETNGILHPAAALELDRTATGLLEHACSRTEGHWRAFFV